MVGQANFFPIRVIQTMPRSRQRKTSKPRHRSKRHRATTFRSSEALSEQITSTTAKIAKINEVLSSGSLPSLNTIDAVPDTLSGEVAAFLPVALNLLNIILDWFFKMQVFLDHLAQHNSKFALPGVDLPYTVARVAEAKTMILTQVTQANANITLINKMLKYPGQTGEPTTASVS